MLDESRLLCHLWTTHQHMCEVGANVSQRIAVVGHTGKAGERGDQSEFDEVCLPVRK